MQKGWFGKIKKRQVAVLVLTGFFVLLDHCSIEALAFSGSTNFSNPAMTAHDATTLKERGHESHRNHTHHGGTNKDCAQMSCCSDVKAEIQSKGLFLISSNQNKYQGVNDLQAFLAVDTENLPQLVWGNDIGPPGFFPQIHFYQAAFASHAPPQA